MPGAIGPPPKPISPLHSFIKAAFSLSPSDPAISLVGQPFANGTPGENPGGEERRKRGGRRERGWEKGEVRRLLRNKVRGGEPDRGQENEKSDEGTSGRER